MELPEFHLARGSNNILANAIVSYSDPNAAGTMPAIVRRKINRLSNVNAVRSFLSSYMGGTGIVLRLKGPDTNLLPEATYVQRALANVCHSFVMVVFFPFFLHLQLYGSWRFFFVFPQLTH